MGELGGFGRNSRTRVLFPATAGRPGETALRAGHFFGTSPKFWLNLQTLHDLRFAEAKAGKSINALPKLKRSEAVHA